MDKLKTGMNQLCANIMGHLVNNGFYTTMQVVIVTEAKEEINTRSDNYINTYIQRS